MAAVVILDSSDHPQNGRPIAGLNHCIQFGSNRFSSFDNIKVGDFFSIWLENAYSRRLLDLDLTSDSVYLSVSDSHSCPWP